MQSDQPQIKLFIFHRSLGWLRSQSCKIWNPSPSQVLAEMYSNALNPVSATTLHSCQTQSSAYRPKIKSFRRICLADVIQQTFVKGAAWENAARLLSGHPLSFQFTNSPCNYFLSINSIYYSIVPGNFDFMQRREPSSLLQYKNQTNYGERLLQQDYTYRHCMFRTYPLSCLLRYY